MEACGMRGVFTSVHGPRREPGTQLACAATQDLWYVHPRSRTRTPHHHAPRALPRSRCHLLAHPRPQLTGWGG
eukprot:365885-Chlamydomonas_euryale.AAC.3